MTVEMQRALEREMEDAMKIDDASRRGEAVMTVIVHQLACLVDCQRKTADRVKVLYDAHERRKWIYGVVITALTSGFGVMGWIAHKMGVA